MLNSAISNTCVDLQVFEDGLLEDVEMLQLRVESNDSSILIMEPSDVTISIINTDG